MLAIIEEIFNNRIYVGYAYPLLLRWHEGVLQVCRELPLPVSLPPACLPCFLLLPLVVASAAPTICQTLQPIAKQGSHVPVGLRVLLVLQHLCMQLV